MNYECEIIDDVKI